MVQNRFSFFSVKNHNKFSSQNIVISSQNIVPKDMNKSFVISKMPLTSTFFSGGVSIGCTVNAFRFFFSVKNHNKFSSQNIVISSQNIVTKNMNKFLNSKKYELYFRAYLETILKFFNIRCRAIRQEGLLILL